MASAASTKKLAGNVPPGSFAVDIAPHSAPTSPTMTSLRNRTVSSSTYTKQPNGNSTTDERQDNGHTPFPISSMHDYSQTNLNEASSRARRSSATTSGVHFSMPKTFSISSPLGFFSRRRKSMLHPKRSSDDTLGEVLEIGPDSRRVESDANAINEDEERNRLRDAAAQALGLGLGRDSSGTPEPTPEDTELAETTLVAKKPSNPYVLDPIPRIPPLNSLTPTPSSLISLPNSHSHLASLGMNTVPGSSYTVPPFPSTLSALKPYIQTSSSLLKYRPASTFFALTLNRRAKQWKLHYVVLTSPPLDTFTTYDSLSTLHSDVQQRPNADVLQLRPDALQVSNGDFLPSPRSSHLHLFRSASPALEDMEIDRLEINEDSIVYVAELDIGGKRDVVKVGGRDARRKIIGSGGVSFKSSSSSWHGSTKADSEANTEEMGRTMWLLKMADGPEIQQWMGHIKTAVFTQRAERAGMTFRQHTPVPNMRADLDVLLSLRSQALLPSVAVSSETTMLPYPGQTVPSTDTMSQGISTYPSQSPSSQVIPQRAPSSFGYTSSTHTAVRASTPTPNPRYAEHVGAAPSHPTPAALRARTYPTSSASNHGLPSLKSLFSATASPSHSGFGHLNESSPGKRSLSSRRSSRPSSPLHDSEKDIDPISDDVISLGNRATAFLNVFRSSSRASNNHNGSGNYLTTMTPESTTRSHGLGTPISTDLYSDETVRGKPSSGSQSTAFSVDWSMINDSGHGSTGSNLNRQTPSGTSSLPPPPRHPRRPFGSSIIRGNTTEPPSCVVKQADHPAHIDGEGSPLNQRSASPYGPLTPSSSAVSPPPSAPLIPGNSSFRGGRPPSANSTSSYASAEGDHSSEVDRGNSLRRSRIVPKMVAPQNSPPPNASSLRAHSPSSPPSPILEQDVVQRNGNGRPELSSSATTTWGSQHPYSNRVSSSSVMSVKTASTGHSFLGSKAPPPLRPPPNFSPPPAPTDTQDGIVHATTNRESFISRSLRLSLVPPAGAPPTQSLPPRPDEPGYRHRRAHSSEVKLTNGLSPITASPTPSPVIAHPSAPPPSGPLPPIPDTDRDRPSSKESRHTSLSHRLRILSSPSPPSLTQASANDAMVDPHRRPIGEPILTHSDAYPSMFLNMSDTPITPAGPHTPIFFPVPSLRPEEDNVEPTPLSPPPRRNSRNSKELRVFNHEKDDTKLTTFGTPLSPQDSAVVLQHR